MHKQGLNDDCLKILFHAIILSKVLYALSVWDGYISEDNVQQVNKLLRKAKCYSFIDTSLTFPELVDQSGAQCRLFQSLSIPFARKRQLCVPNKLVTRSFF